MDSSLQACTILSKVPNGPHLTASYYIFRILSNCCFRRQTVRNKICLSASFCAKFPKNISKNKNIQNNFQLRCFINKNALLMLIASLLHNLISSSCQKPTTHNQVALKFNLLFGLSRFFFTTVAK